MKFGLTALTGLLLVVASALPSQAGFDLSIGNISVNGTGGAFTVFAKATGQNESVASYTLRLNLTNASAGELPVTFAEGPGQAAGFGYFESIPNNTIAAFGGGVAGNSVGFSANVIGASVNFTQNALVQVGTFSFTTANGFNLGDFVDVGIVIGPLDSQFASPLAIPLNAVGGTNQAGNNPTVATSTRIAAVPEPSMFGLLGLVGAGLGLRRKRKAIAA